MIAGLKPYPAMKDSVIEWLGKVPEHWEVVPLCSIARPKSITNKENRELLSVYLDLGVIHFSDVKEKRTNVTSENLSKYQAVDPGDFVLNNQQAWRGSVGVSEYKGIISPAYLVLSLDSRIQSNYANYLFRDKTMVSQYLICSKGVGSIQRNLYWPHLKRVSMFLPPLSEQAAIVRYLDHVERRVRRYVRAKRKLIELLKGQRQAIIHHAVIRGLNPDVPLKNSGVKWLGEVPEHWEVLRTRYLFCEVDKRSSTGQETHLSMSQLLGLVPSDLVQSTLTSESYVGGKLCEEDDLVLNRLKAHLGVFALAKQAGVISPDYSVFRKKRPMDMSYFEYVLRSPACRYELRIRAKGIVEGFWRLYTDDFYNIRLPVPPVGEQEKIIGAISKSTADIDTVIAHTNREIKLLNEYRTRLITDVVTGKLDVREVAAALPGEDSLGTEEDQNETLNLDDGTDLDELDTIPEETEA